MAVSTASEPAWKNEVWQLPRSPSGMTPETFLASSMRLGLVMSVVCMIRPHWRLDGLEHLGVAPAHGVHGHAGRHVYVEVAVGVLDRGALALLEDDREPAAAAGEGLVLGRFFHECGHLRARARWSPSWEHRGTTVP